MYICEHCGLVTDELRKYREYHGEPWAQPEVMTDYDCPNCGIGTLLEGAECAVCGVPYAVEDLHGGTCETCLKGELEVTETVCEYLYDTHGESDFYLGHLYGVETENPDLAAIVKEDFWKRAPAIRLELLEDFISQDWWHFADWLKKGRSMPAKRQAV